MKVDYDFIGENFSSDLKLNQNKFQTFANSQVKHKTDKYETNAMN